ncbi:hypothetical protein [uncultured Akkermansia sp.]|uniref:hypothetical protein n=1 Tax=uncultured Akkermansia sp. TaxID=512294 RepID=UPI00259807DB|nr:hypothetical protein [uncultured Akkermansia sp.]
MNTKIDTETAAQFVSMRLASYGNLPFQVLSPTPYPGKIGVRLHPDERYCIVDAVGFLAYLDQQRPSLDKLRDMLSRKRRQHARQPLS